MYHAKTSKAQKKRKHHQGGVATETSIGQSKNKNLEVKGGGSKIKTVLAEKVNALINGTYQQVSITSLKENPASKDLTRRKIITKGTILTIKTNQGKEMDVRVVSRPGQEGTINAIAI